MDDDRELLRLIKVNIDKALRLAEAEEEKVKWYRLSIRDKAKARNYDNIKSLLKTISRNIELNTENK
jgi:hypothetical protein|nr:MAG TPA: hypothetical protein [Crassvirales sp.]